MSSRSETDGVSVVVFFRVQRCGVPLPQGAMEEAPPAAAPPALRASRAETRFLFVANAGSKLGDTEKSLRDVFGAFGEVDAVHVPDPTVAQCLVSMRSSSAARLAREATHKRPCAALRGRELWVQFARDPATDGNGTRSGRRVAGGTFLVNDAEARIRAARKLQESEMCAAARSSDLMRPRVPGLTLIPEFITPYEEREILSIVDSWNTKWQRLAKRRVAHFGYDFDYGLRNAETESENGRLPDFCEALLTRLHDMRDTVPGAEIALLCDQLTVNEYPAGVGLAPHVDTHSAFGCAVFSLSLAGNAAMEFRKLAFAEDPLDEGSFEGANQPRDEPRVVERAAIALPPRSMLALAGQARYEWQHYVPHRKRDVVAAEETDARETGGCRAASTPRAPRRVSLTFRQRRDVAKEGPCACAWPAACDSRQGAAQRLKQRHRPGLVAKALGEGRREGRAPETNPLDRKDVS